MARQAEQAGRARLGVVAGLVALVAAAGTAFGLLHDGPAHRDRPTTTSSSAPNRSTTSIVPPPPTGIHTYRVATTSLVAAVPGSAPTETSVPVSVWYPQVPRSAESRRMHHRARPLLVFSQGFAQPVQAYDTLLTDWASAGFVVAAPTYPHTQPPTTAGDPTPATPPLLTRRDIVHHPADLSAVIDSVVSESRDGASPLKGLVDASEIGLVGQSDGGNVSLAVADDSCCRLGSVRAVAVLSGAEMATFGGQYFPPGTTSPHSPPLLVAQGDDDTINPPACSAQIYDAAPQPKYFLDLLGATHLDPYTQPSPYESIVATVTTDFFDAELAHQRPAVTAMSTDGNVAGAAELVDGPTAPTAPGDCPGAPAEAP